MATALGPFQLLHPIGHGGMGAVWLAAHREQAVPVAVKVVTGRRASEDRYRRAFQREVSSVARLDHPSVVWVFDYGSIPAEAERATGGALTAGSPYLVMEYASHGTLRTLTRTLSWSEIRALLLTLLDALAHAHARGVIHRDLKPDNVLISGVKDLRPGFKLSDFGIAYATDHTSVTDARGVPIGTPHYMAPEQVRGEAEAYSPATDLYALGTLVYRLVSGVLPYAGKSAAALLYAKLHREPDPLDPRMRVPPGLDAWLSTMMARDRRDRFQSAADAALALSRLPRLEAEDDPGDGVLIGAVSATDTGPSAQTPLQTVVPTLEGRERALTAIMERPTSRERRVPRMDPRRRPPLPVSWRRQAEPARRLRLLGAGLGLWGLRPPPFVGRDEERDELWSALRDVHRDGQARVVLVRGAPGTGKSRLVQWVTQRAHEVGGAKVLSTSMSATESETRTLRRLLLEAIRREGFGPEQAQKRFGGLVRTWGMSPDEPLEGLEALLDPGRAPLSPGQWQALVRGILERLSSDRPTVVALDDAHVSVAALRVARHVLDVQPVRSCATLLVLALSDDAIAPHSECARLVEELGEREATRVVHLEALPPRRSRELVRRLLGLRSELAEDIARATHGNPQFAVQLVGDWVERGALEPTSEGFALRDRADAALPKTLEEVWERRAARLLEGCGPDAGLMLERAAILGREVDLVDWVQVCDDPEGHQAAQDQVAFRPAGARARRALQDRLLAAGLAEVTEDGFVFTHETFRSTLLQRARSAGRWRAHHSACAAVLLHTAPPSEAERIGTHLLEAGQAQAAVDPLLRAVRRREDTAGSRAALALLDVVHRTLVAAELPEADPRWAEVELRRAINHAELDQARQATRCASRALAQARQHGWNTLAAGAYNVLGGVALQRGDGRAAEASYLRAVRLLGRHGDPYHSARAWHRLRQLATDRGDVEEARRRGEQVRAHAIRSNDDRGRSFGYAALSAYALSVGDLADARACAERSLAVARRLGDLSGEARAQCVLGEVTRAESSLAEARAHLQAAVDRYDAVGSSAAHLVRCRLALVECHVRRFQRARATMEPALAAAEHIDDRVAAAVHLVSLLACAGLRRWAPAEHHLAEAERLVPGCEALHVDYADVPRRAGHVAVGAGQLELAQRAWELARASYEAAGRVEECGEVQALLDALKG